LRVANTRPLKPETKQVITGYNTDVEHGGVVYHVQTEDKGLQTPIILSLVYSGGAILASKRAPYDDLIATGFDQKVLVERLQRQHKLICAAINAGRIDDLKRMGERPTGSLTNSPANVVAPDHEEDKAPPEHEEDRVDPEGIAPTEPLPSAVERFSTSEEPEEGLSLILLDDRQMRAGESVTLRIEVAKHGEGEVRPAAKANITVKVLGSTFQPSSTYSMTDSFGHSSISLTLPTFKAGRGAILIRAESDGEFAELRRVIHPA